MANVVDDLKVRNTREPIYLFDVKPLRIYKVRLVRDLLDASEQINNQQVAARGIAFFAGYTD